MFSSLLARDIVIWEQKVVQGMTEVSGYMSLILTSPESNLIPHFTILKMKIVYLFLKMMFRI